MQTGQESHAVRASRKSLTILRATWESIDNNLPRLCSSWTGGPSPLYGRLILGRSACTNLQSDWMRYPPRYYPLGTWAAWPGWVAIRFSLRDWSLTPRFHVYTGTLHTSALMTFMSPILNRDLGFFCSSSSLACSLKAHDSLSDGSMVNMERSISPSTGAVWEKFISTLACILACFHLEIVTKARLPMLGGQECDW